MQHVKPSDLPTVEAAAPPIASVASRLLFIDNVRWVMIVLVLSMHAAVTYSPLGSWYYREHPPLGPAGLLFFATYQNWLQGFFMALLFFVAGYFTPRSYDAKGAGAFLAGRLHRLGWPTLLFVAVLGPFTEYFVAHSWTTRQSFAHEMLLYVTRGRFLSGTGPLWFCAALLIFTVFYALARLGGLGRGATSAPARIGAAGVALTVAGIALSTFLVRLFFPLGSSVFNMQLCYFPSYVIMFALGVAAARRDWVTNVGARFAFVAAGACVGAAMLMWLPLLVLGGALGGHADLYQGGPTWQAAGLSLWEAMICVGMSFCVLAGFRAWLSGQGPFSRFMSKNAFAVYVVHPPILIAIAIAIAPLALAPVAKFALLWALSAIVCFGAAAPIARRLPLLGRIL
jgi:glucans biosynthesis protein C